MKTNDITNKIFCGHSLPLLKTLPAGSVDCIVTSPPYFGQRDYGASEQIGTEKTPEKYIENLTAIFTECFRILKDTGTMWVNLGDKYLNGNLLGMPWRLALALQSDGWVLRNDIVWHKPNAMPHSAKNRLTTDHEYIFFFTKKERDYYYEQDAIREPHVTFSEKSKMKGGRNHFGKQNGTPEKGKNGGNGNLHDGRWNQAFHPKGRNRRTVWNVSLSKYRGAHFAVFPEKLIEPCILSGCPENGLVLDPFFGAGTSGLVALQNCRNFVGLEINPEYVELSKQRLFSAELPLLNFAENRD